MGKKDERVDAYIARAAPFAQPILQHLRKLVHAGCPGVEETIKWGAPAFMYKGMLGSMAAFKQHCAFGFWKGALIEGLPRNVGEAAGSLGRITSLDDLPSDKQTIALVEQAAALNDQGVRTPKIRKPERNQPSPGPSAELLAAVKKNRAAQAAFETFSPSHKREYSEWINEAKTEETKKKRVETAIGWIAEGKRRHWKYQP